MENPRSSPNTAVPSKVIAPRGQGLFPRSRLLSLLDAASHIPVLWVSGPPGSGKTALAASYVASRGLPCAWCTLDSGDDEPATFFHFLGLAAAAADRSGTPSLPAFSPDHLQGVPEFSRLFFEALFARPESPELVVLDDFQELDEDSPIASVLLQGLNRFPQGRRLLVLSRTRPPAPFVRLLAERRMASIGWDQLRLTLGEFADLAHHLGLEAAESREFPDWHRDLDGWAAGLVLAAAGAPLGSDRSRSRDPEAFFGYLASEVLSSLAPETREFFMRTAHVPSVSADSAQRLTGRPDSGALLQDLYQAHCLTAEEPGGSGNYRYHPFLRRFLLRLARETYPAEELDQIQLAAARELLRAGDPETAADLFAATRNWLELERVVRDHAAELLRQGRIRRVTHWLDSFPEAVLRRSPWLLYWFAESRRHLEPSLAGKRYESAFEAFRAAGGDVVGLLSAWAGGMEAITAGLDDFAAAGPWLDRLREVVGDCHGVPPGEVGDRVVAAVYKALVLGDGRHPEFRGWEARALNTLRGKATDLQHDILCSAGFSKTWRGELGEAELVLHRLQSWDDAENCPPAARLRGRFVRAFFAGVVGRHGDAVQQVDTALAEGKRCGVRTLEPMLLSVGARAALNRGDLATARDYTTRLQGLLPRTGQWCACFLHQLRAALGFQEHQLPKSKQEIKTALALLPHLGIGYGPAAVHLLAAQIDHADGKQEPAHDHLEAARRGAEQFHFAPLLLSVELTTAQWELETGRDSAGRLLERAFRYGAEHGDLAPYWYPPQALAELCAQALDRGIQPEYVRSLVERCELAPRNPPLEVEQWPWPVRIYTLGRFELVLRGSPLRCSGKAQHKPLQLLKVLIALGGRGVSESRIADALWPDADGDAARQSLKTALHRLRKLLRIPDAVRYQDGTVTLDAQHCWVDVWALERLLSRVEVADAGRAEPYLRRAVALYRGTFLESENNGYWAISLRERLRSRYLRVISLAGRKLEATGAWRAAKEYYERALEVDPLLEELYRHLMVCGAKLGNVGEVRSIYGRCEVVMNRALGIPVSQQTRDLLQELSPSPAG